MADEEQEDFQRRIDTFIKINAELFDKAKAYTNLLIVAGYAAFFTVWTTMKDAMSTGEMLWAALSMSVSLIIFVVWELTLMIVRAMSFRRLNDVTRGVTTPEQLDAAIAAYQQYEYRVNSRASRSWVVVLTLTVVPGLLGGTILILSFLRQLVNFYGGIAVLDLSLVAWGLVLDVVGFVLVFLFGGFDIGREALLAESDWSEKAKPIKIVGAVLIILGFLLQLIGKLS